MDFRAPGGAVGRADQSRRGASPLYGLLFISGIGSLAFAVVAAMTDDTLVSASLLTTYAAANTMMLLLVDFTSVVVSPEDYNILGHRPVGSRTYFAARLAAIGVYVGGVSGVLGLAPALVYGVKFGILAGAATLLAVLICGLSYGGPGDHRIHCPAPLGASSPAEARHVVPAARGGDILLRRLLSRGHLVPGRVSRSGRFCEHTLVVGAADNVVRGAGGGRRR
jgi:hypothetical protein